MKRPVLSLLAAALLVSAAAACAAATPSGSRCSAPDDENLTAALRRNVVGRSYGQYIKSLAQVKMNGNFRKVHESLCEGGIISVSALSGTKDLSAADSFLYQSAADAASAAGSLQLRFITENTDDCGLTQAASMPPAGAYSEKDKTAALTPPEALPAGFAESDGRLRLPPVIVKADAADGAPAAPSAPAVDISGYKAQTEVTAATEPRTAEGALNYVPIGGAFADTVAEALVYCGVEELTQYGAISVLTSVGVGSAGGAEIKISVPYTVTAVLNPGVAVPGAAELRVLIHHHGDVPVPNSLTASVMPVELHAASAPPLLDFPADYDAETNTVTFTTEGEVVIPASGITVTLAAAARSAPSLVGGSGGGGTAALRSPSALAQLRPRRAENCNGSRDEPAAPRP